ncbi:MAG: bifunctional diguanylate cyclase/phosphodiesterase [Eubacteriales bacterium]
MDRKKFYDVYFGNHKNPCVITDRDTHECLFANDVFFKVYKVSRDIVGNNFYDYVPLIENHMEEEIPNWDEEYYYETDSYNVRLNRQFLMRAVYNKIDNTIFCEAIPVENDLEKNSNFEDAMTRCMDIYQQPEETVMISFMELLCDFYECERAYVYRFNFQDSTINCVSQWCLDPNFRVTEEVGTKMDATFLIDWIQEEHVAGIVSADSEKPDFPKDSTLAKIMNTFKMRNLALCNVEDSNHKVVGVVGLSNRKDCNQILDRRLLNTISKFVALDVTQQTVNTNLFQVENRDVLTGMYNRFAYDKKVTSIQKEQPQKLGVISVNINGLKNINNNLGNEAGDEHIKKSGKKIQSHFGFDIFRVSGDEFIGLASDVDKEEFEYKVATMQRELREEGNYDFSMGSCWAEGKYDYVSLLREADSVMYINKQEYYAAGLRTLSSVSSVILRDLLSFLENDEFMIYLQPQVRLEDGSLHGAEALIRRFDKTNQKMVFPDQFISMYEQASVIRHIDLFVVETVCQLLAKWEDMEKGIPISVNLSRVTLQEFGIVDTIVKICDKHNVPHSLLVIEVTERVGLIENDVPSALVTDFIDHGFTISLDDFGCAYSNIVTLAQIEVDEVKLDKSLVDNLTTNRKNHILVKNVLSMCEELEGMSTLAEGIEDEEQSDLLHELGCHLGQGYFYSRPMPVEDFENEYIFQEASVNV